MGLSDSPIFTAPQPAVNAQVRGAAALVGAGIPVLLPVPAEPAQPACCCGPTER